MKTALLVMVHGSPDPSANDPMFGVVDMIRQRRIYGIVEAGFLECNEPTIPEAIATCVERGAERIDAVPYFLHTGNHVTDDIPTLLNEARRSYADVEFRLGDFLGRSPRLTDLLAKRAHTAESRFRRD